MTENNKKIWAYLVDNLTGLVLERRFIDKERAIRDNEAWRWWDKRPGESCRIRWQDENREEIREDIENG